MATGPGAVDARPAWRRWALAAVPWVAAAGLVTVGWSGRRPPPATATPLPTHDAAPTDAPTPAEDTSAPPAVDLPPVVELAVVAAARTALGTAGLPSAGPTPDRWPVEVRVVDVTTVSDRTAVATVHGLVIERDGDAWGAPVLRAVAVPLRLGPDPVVLGDAWALPSPGAPSVDLTATPVEDPDAAALDPLEDLGWTVTTVEAIDLVDGHLLRVVLDGTAPDAARPTRHTVWLLDTPGGPRPLTPPPAR